MDVFKERHYKVNEVMLSLVGQWPYQNPRKRLLYRFVACILYATFVEVQIMKLITSEIGVDLLLETIPSIMGVMICGTKYFNCWIRMEIIKHLLEQIKHDWKILRKRNEISILRKNAETGAMYELCYIFCGGLCISAFWILQFVPSILDIIVPLNESRPFRFPFKLEYLIDSEKYFYVIVFHINLSTLVLLIMVLASDILFVTLVIHACGIVNVLGYKLEHLFDDMKRKCNSPKVYNTQHLNRILYVRIKECVIYHINVSNIFFDSIYTDKDLVEPILHVYMHIGYSFHTIFRGILSTVWIEGWLSESILTGNYGESVLCILYIVGHFIGIFISILPAQKLLNYSNDIYYKAYFAKWYYTPSETQKLLLLIIQRTKEPYSLTAAGLLTASYEMLTAILQMSLSYFTVLYSLR